MGRKMSINLTRNNLFVKVPAVTAFFWLIKVLATTVGETFADFINTHLNLGLSGTSAVMGTALLIALVVQFSVKICADCLLDDYCSDQRRGHVNHR